MYIHISNCKSLEELETAVETIRARCAFSLQFLVLPNFPDLYFYHSMETQRMVSISWLIWNAKQIRPVNTNRKATVGVIAPQQAASLYYIILYHIISYYIRYYLRNREHFQSFHTVIETQMEVWENEKLKWEHEPRSANVSTQFRVFPNFHECFYNVWNMGKNVFYFFYKITRRKLKRGNSLLYQSVNSPYCSWWRMRWRDLSMFSIPSYGNMAFSQWKLPLLKCYFIIINICTGSSTHQEWVLGRSCCTIHKPIKT